MLRWLAPLTRGSARSSNQGPAGLRNDMALLAPFSTQEEKIRLANSHKEPKGSKLNVTTEFGASIWARYLRKIIGKLLSYLEHWWSVE